MKIFRVNNTMLAVVFTLSLLMSGCRKDDPSEQEITTNGLTSHPWKIGSVVIDGIDQTSQFTGMTLTFTSTDYSTTNGGLVWPANGTWAFVGNDVTRIKRSDDLEVTIVELSDSDLKLSLVRAADTFGPGRVSSTKGNYTFNFVKV